MIKNKKKNITFDDLAEITQAGFVKIEKNFIKVDENFVKAEKNTDKKIESLALMVAKGFEETAKKVDMNIQFGEVNKRLDKIENILSWEYRGRIEKLESEVKELQTDFRQLVGFKK